jgi:hypothetical protein
MRAAVSATIELSLTALPAGFPWPNGVGESQGLGKPLSRKADIMPIKGRT